MIRPATSADGAAMALLAERRFHVAIGGISLPNAASVALHERLVRAML